MVADAAVLAAGPAAIGGLQPLEGPVPLGQQKGPADAAVQMVPGQDLIRVPLPQVEVRVHPGLLKGLAPGLQAQMFAPGVQAAAQAVGRQQNRRQAPVAPGEDALQPGLGRGVPFRLDLPVAQAVLDPVQKAAAFLQIRLPLPLKGGVGFGNEAPQADVEPGAAGAGLQDLPGQRRDGLPVRLGLSGQAQHESRASAGASPPRRPAGPRPG